MELNDLVSEQLMITLYGELIHGLELKRPNAGKGDILFPSRILGVKAAGQCVRLPKAYILLLQGAGEELTSPECGWEQPTRKWVVDPKCTAASISIAAITPESLIQPQTLQPRLDVTADFHFHNVSLHGTTIDGWLRSYLHLHQNLPLGQHIDVTVVDRDDHFSINFVPDTCITVYSIGVASAEACYHPNPNRVCGEVHVDVDVPVIGGYHHVFTVACVNL